MKRKKRRGGFKVSPAHASQGRIFGQTGAYLMGSIVYPFRNKWGISDRTDLRRGQVDKDVTGPVYTVFCREIMFGWTCEQFVHFIYQLQNAPIKKTTGGTEWFYNFSPIFGSFILWALFRLQIQVEWYWKAVAYISPFVWIDGLLWLILFRLLGWGFAFVLALGTWYFYTHS